MSEDRISGFEDVGRKVASPSQCNLYRFWSPQAPREARIKLRSFAGLCYESAFCIGSSTRVEYSEAVVQHSRVWLVAVQPHLMVDDVHWADASTIIQAICTYLVSETLIGGLTRPAMLTHSITTIYPCVASERAPGCPARLSRVLLLVSRAQAIRECRMARDSFLRGSHYADSCSQQGF
jgi:hypothetical protein